MDALRAARARAEQQVREGDDITTAFLYFVSINEALNDQAATTKLFQWLDKERPDKAKRLQFLASAALIASEQYELALKYIDVEHELDTFLYHRRRLMRQEKDEPMASQTFSQLSRFTWAISLRSW